MIYCTANDDEFKNYLKKIEPIEQEFHPDKFDCDDFALIMSAHIKLVVAAQNLLPHGLAFGEIVVRNSLSGSVHQLNVLIHDVLTFSFFEPQGKIFVDGKNYKPFFVRI
jgi:hypothetical protein